MLNDKELLQQALDVLNYVYEGAQNQGPFTGISWNNVENKTAPMIETIKARLAQPKPEPEPATIWYMRDNHTFKRLSADVSTALIEIEQEFNEGYTYGMLCSKQKGFSTVLASGEKKRLEFFAECKKTLEEWLPNTTPPQRSEPSGKPSAWVGLTDEEVEEAGKLNIEGKRMLPYSFAKAIEAKLKEKNT